MVKLPLVKLCDQVQSASVSHSPFCAEPHFAVAPPVAVGQSLGLLHSKSGECF